MRQMRIPTLIMLVLMGLVLLLMACTGGDEPAAPAETAPTGQEAGEQPDAPSDEPVELTFWMASNPNLEAAMNDIIQAYMAAHPNVTVKQEAFPFAEYFQKIFTGFAADSAPDVFWVDVRTASFASRGVLLPLEPYLTEAYRSEVISSAWIEGTWDGTVYSVPLHQLTEALYVNKQMAEEAGIPLPTSVADAWSWDELVEYATRLTVREGNQTLVWGFGMERHLQDWPVTGIIHQNGGQTLSPDLKQADGYLNSEATVNAVAWLADLVREHQVMPIEPIPDGFPNGQIAIFHGTSTYRAVLDSKFPDFEYVVIPLYKGSAGCAVTAGGWNVGISRSTAHPDEAWSLVEWMTRERHSEWVEKSGYLPIRENIMSESRFSELPWSIFLEELNECSVNRPATPEYQLWGDLMNAATKDIAVGGDAQAVMDDVATKMDQQLSR